VDHQGLNAMNENILNIVQIILGIILVGLVLLQGKGSGLGGTFGSNMAFYSTRRGAEKLIFIITIIISFLFLVTSLLGVVI